MLGLVPEEMRIAKAVRIAPETYARHKAELLAERDARDAKMADMDCVLLARRDHPADGSSAEDRG
jgi:hypothetical protein